MAAPFANEQLSAFLDGELSDAERTELEAALEADPELRAELDALEDAVSFLRRHGPVSAPEGFQQRVLAAVADEPMPGAWWRWLRRPFGIPIEGLAVAAVAALVLLVALPTTLVVGNLRGSDLGDPLAYREPATNSTPAKEELAKGGEKGADKARDTGAAVADVDIPPPPRAKPAATASPSPVQMTAATPASGDGQADDDTLSILGGSRGVGGGGSADASSGSASSADSTDAIAQTQKRKTVGGSIVYRFDVVTYDSGALSSLQRIAAAYRGQLTDSRGQVVRPGDDASGTFYVRLPAERLAEFGDALRDLGAVTELANDDAYADAVVTVQIQLTVMPAQAYQPKASRSASEAAEPASVE